MSNPLPLDKRPAFESLCRSIVSQQLSVKAAETIWQRLTVLYGGDLLPDSVLSMGERRHRAVGISGQKHSYLVSLAERFQCCSNDFSSTQAKTDDEIIRLWTEVKGLGKWTVQMHLIFQLDRPDVFPVDDLGIRRAMELHLDIPKDCARSVYEKRALIWSPFRTAASRFLWMSIENQPK